MKDSGGLCVMISGTFPMPRLCAGSWDVAGPSQLRVVLILAKAQAASCWTICGARETSLPCGIVITADGGDTTATTTKMLVLSVQVLSLFFLFSKYFFFKLHPIYMCQHRDMQMSSSQDNKKLAVISLLLHACCVPYILSDIYFLLGICS